MTDDLCECPNCGRMHKPLCFGKPPEAIALPLAVKDDRHEPSDLLAVRQHYDRIGLEIEKDDHDTKQRAERCGDDCDAVRDEWIAHHGRVELLRRARDAIGKAMTDWYATQVLPPHIIKR